MTLVWNPPVPLGAAALIGVALVLVLGALLAVRRPPVSLSLGLRLAALCLIAAALFDPRVVTRTFKALPDIALVVSDDSASQDIGGRPAQTEAARAALARGLSRLQGVETRFIHAGAGASLSDGTRLFDAVRGALSDVPQGRVGAIFLITDGIVHDVPPDLGAGWGAPVHVLLTGEPGQADRRIDLLDQPDFALVGQSARLRFRVVADGEPAGGYPVKIEVDGAPMIQDVMPTGRDLSVDIPIRHAGQTVVDIAVAPGPREVSTANNHRVIGISGVRDRLKVLLLSGAPNVGERVWRNLLKSDPAVDLIHFTILRSPDKEDPTPLSELSLINFPVRQLFEDDLPGFDLVVLDRYRGANLPPGYLDRLADYVRGGGALLMAAGPEYADPQSPLFETQLGEMLPQPLGDPQFAPFLPTLSDVGRRHPVTGDLGPQTPAAQGQAPWGRWLSLNPAQVRSGNVLMRTPDGKPVLLVDRVGDGRLGVFLSDSIWLWARGWDGGGPYHDLLRRLLHWLMKEPELEEERLWGVIDNNRLTVNRRSLNPVPPPITVTSPSGKTATVTLTDQGNGMQTAALPVSESGVWRLSDGKTQALAVDGDPSPLEMNEVAATSRLLAPVAAKTGGWLGWVSQGGAPEVRRSSGLDRASGSSWAGVMERNAQVVTGLDQSSNWPGLLLFALSGVLLAVAWIRESK